MKYYWLILAIRADEPIEGCKDTEVGLICRGDCEKLYQECHPTCYDEEQFLDPICEKNCLAEVLIC